MSQVKRRGMRTRLAGSHAKRVAGTGLVRVRPKRSARHKSIVSAYRMIASGDEVIEFNPKVGITRFVKQISSATPIQRVHAEQAGVDGRLLKAMAYKMGVPATRFFTIIGIPKATAERKASSHQRVAGASGHAALGMVQLLGIAQNMADNSTAAEAKAFDTAKWLGRWIEQPQPALGGKTPAELLNTPTGIAVVSQVLGAIESGAYL